MSFDYPGKPGGVEVPIRALSVHSFHPYSSGQLLARRTRLLFAAHITAVRRGQPDVARIRCDTGLRHGPWPE